MTTLAPWLTDQQGRLHEASLAWFRGHPGDQWRIRPADPIELLLHCADPGALTSIGQPLVLVVLRPSRRGCIHVFFVGDPSAHPDDVWPGISSTFDAADDAEFFRRLGRLGGRWAVSVAGLVGGGR